MNCKEFRNSYSDFRDERISDPILRRSLEQHLAVCTDCASFHETLEQGVSLIYSSGELLVSPDFRRRLKQKLEDSRADQALVMPAHAGFTLAAMAAALALLVVGSGPREEQPLAQTSVPAEVVEFPQLIAPPTPAAVGFTEMEQAEPPISDLKQRNADSLADWVLRHP